MISIKVLLPLLCVIPCTISTDYSAEPEQVHLAYGASTSEIVVTWNTMKKLPSAVRYWLKDESKAAECSGGSIRFQDGGDQRREQYIHKVVLKRLKPNTVYKYRCGSKFGWSITYTFRTTPATADWVPHLAIFGDMGNFNAMSLPNLQAEVQTGMYDAILHVGDIAYDMDTDNARVGDDFMRQIEPIAAYVPYMVCPGNHEEAYNFSNYKARFFMPNGPDRLYYSFDLGPAHFISFTTEYYYYLEYCSKCAINQYYWLEKDLMEANKPKNRKKHPWIITFGHRPMYCSNKDNDCRKGKNPVRTGLEKLFYKYGVDMEIWAHEHSYERLWPIYDKKVFNGSYHAPYTNPKAPVHITTGSAGSDEFVDGFADDPAEWSAFRDTDYGYTRMKIVNRTHLWFQQVSVEEDGEAIDEVWLIKDKHGPYARN